MQLIRSHFNGPAALTFVVAMCTFCAQANADTSVPASAPPQPPAQTAPAVVTAPTAAPVATPNPTVETVPADQEPQPQSPPPMIGFDVGEYLPTDRVVQNRFGSQWFTVGIGEGTIAGPTKRGSFKLDIDLMANTKGDNRAILIPLGLQYERALSSGPLTPYAGISGDVVSSIIQSDTDGVKSKYRAALAASAFAGVNFSSIASLELRYRTMQKIAGYNLNGYGITAGLRF